MEEIIELLKNSKFEAAIPDVFFKCEYAVFLKEDENSLCYTTSKERAELIASILNEWAVFKREKK
ncbi:hypothetical protein LCGC14_0872020 [marine sediment metagenome]|uniref:Uncharacterized protein n=1 Tax=marine sediment metagenome TaxID=412755 RepID=A0A0F9P4F1_9ZZZZ